MIGVSRLEYIISLRKVLSYETHEWMKLKDTCTLLTNNIVGLFLQWFFFWSNQFRVRIDSFCINIHFLWQWNEWIATCVIQPCIFKFKKKQILIKYSVKHDWRLYNFHRTSKIRICSRYFKNLKFKISQKLYFPTSTVLICSITSSQMNFSFEIY